MQRLLLLVTIFVLTISSYGAQRSESSAADIATKFFLNSQPSLRSVTKDIITPRLVHQIEKNGETAIYVYSNHVAKGFVLIAGDDAVTPILGYSDSGSFYYESMPANAKWWIDSYANQIQAIKEGKAIAATTIKSSTAVAPLLGKTVWGQDQPYNTLAPSYQGAKCPTGCVATAMAQVMYYHQWPEIGSGSKSYISKTYKFELSADFSKSTYLWNAMTPTYNAQSTAESKEEVAKLMYDCGVSVEMDYDPNGSGTIARLAAKAFIENFNYDKGIQLLSRNYYTAEEWTMAMKSELDNSRPFVYGGRTGTDMFAEGHEFVCDGYNTDGLFHINWGWNGMSNGYFLLSLLNPDDQGTGGSSTGGGYNVDQHAIVGIQKPTANPIMAPYFLVLSDNNKCNVEDKTDIRIIGSISNEGYNLFSGTISAELIDTSTGNSALTQEIMTTEIMSDLVQDAKNYSTKITLPSTLRGEYKLNYYSVDKNGNKFEVRTNILKPVIIITDQGITIKNRYSGFVVSNVKIKIEMSSSFMSFYNYSFDLTNTGDHDILETNLVDSYVRMLLTKNNQLLTSRPSYYSLKKGETIKISNSQIPIPPGEISISFEDHFGNNLYGDVIKMNIPKHIIFLLEKASIKNAESVNPKEFQLDATIKNVSAVEEYNGNVYAKIFKSSDDTEMCVVTATAKANRNQSIDVSLVGQFDLPPGSYYASLYYDLASKQTAIFAEDIINKIPFNVITAGIEDMKEANVLKFYPNPAHDYITIVTDNNPDYVRIFNAEGVLLIEKKGTDSKCIQISHLMNGVYIVHVNYMGQVISSKLVKQ